MLQETRHYGELLIQEKVLGMFNMQTCCFELHCRAGCPVTTSGTTINRFCSSGLQAIASIAHSIVHDNVDCGVGGGVDSISLVQPKMVKGAVPERNLLKSYPALWMPMIETVSMLMIRVVGFDFTPFYSG